MREYIALSLITGGCLFMYFSENSILVSSVGMSLVMFGIVVVSRGRNDR